MKAFSNVSRWLVGPFCLRNTWAFRLAQKPGSASLLRGVELGGRVRSHQKHMEMENSNSSSKLPRSRKWHPRLCPGHCSSAKVRSRLHFQSIQHQHPALSLIILSGHGLLQTWACVPQELGQKSSSPLHPAVALWGIHMWNPKGSCALGFLASSGSSTAQGIGETEQAMLWCASPPTTHILTWYAKLRKSTKHTRLRETPKTYKIPKDQPPG